MPPSLRAWCAVAVVVTGCGRSSAPGEIRLGASALAISAPLFLAADQGLFQQHGLVVELKVYDTAQPMVEEVIDGRIDAGGYAAYPIVLLAARGARRSPLVATQLLEDRDHRLSYVLARRGAGLTFPDDARGHRIGILPTAAYQVWLTRILASAGIPADAVTVVPVAPAMQAQTLAEGGIDFLFGNDPAASGILAAGIGEIVDDGPPGATYIDDPFPFGALVLDAGFAADRPADAARLVAAIDEGITRARADPDAATIALERYLPAEQRELVKRFPPTRHLTSAEVTAAQHTAAIAAARALLDDPGDAEAWTRR